MAFWTAEGPQLKRDWWGGGGGIPWGKVEALRDRYCKSHATIERLGSLRHAGCKESVKAFRDYWRSLPQLNEVSQLGDPCDAVLDKLR